MYLQPELQGVVEEFADVFALPKELPPSRPCDHRIPLLEGTNPINVKPYRHPPTQKEAIESMKVGEISSVNSTSHISGYTKNIYSACEARKREKWVLKRGAAGASVEGINSYVFTFYVFLLGFIFLLPCLIIHYRKSNIPAIKFAIVGKIAMLSVLMYLSQIFGYIGLKYSSPTLSSIMSNLSPAFTFVLAYFFSQYFLLAFALVAQAKILQVYSVDLMVVFVFGISGLFVAGFAALVMANDVEAWKLKSNAVLITVLYMNHKHSKNVLLLPPSHNYCTV
nr:nodulin MtN21 /EamA-like transporter family protein [Tanacetum cinerariifolium]